MRKAFNTTLEEDLLKDIKMIALIKGVKINDMFEEMAKRIIEENRELLPKK